MNNIKELHPKEGVVLLAYLQPKKTIDCQLRDDGNTISFGWENGISREYYELPFKCKLLGTPDQITEEVWRGIIHEPEIISEVDNGHDIKEIYGYSDFTDEDNSFNTATESAMSFLQANEVYSVNPKLHPADIETMSIEHYIRLEDNWNKAESNTGTWIILLKL